MTGEKRELLHLGLLHFNDSTLPYRRASYHCCATPTPFSPLFPIPKNVTASLKRLEDNRQRLQSDVNAVHETLQGRMGRLETDVQTLKQQQQQPAANPNNQNNTNPAATNLSIENARKDAEEAERAERERRDRNEREEREKERQHQREMERLKLQQQQASAATASNGGNSADGSGGLDDNGFYDFKVLFPFFNPSMISFVHLPPANPVWAPLGKTATLHRRTVGC